MYIGFSYNFGHHTSFSDQTHHFLNQQYQSQSLFTSSIILSPWVIFTIIYMDYHCYIEKGHKNEVPKGPKLSETTRFKTYDKGTYVLDVWTFVLRLTNMLFIACSE